MGDTGSGQHDQQNAPNFYEFPGTKPERDNCNSNIGLQGLGGGNTYDNTSANLMNRFSPKVSLGQDINNVFTSNASHGHSN